MTHTDIIQAVLDITKDSFFKTMGTCAPISPAYFDNDDFRLRGWLLSPETVKAVFGEEEEEHMISCDLCEESLTLPAWEWHGWQMLPLPTDDLIQYYGKFLESIKK